MEERGGKAILLIRGKSKGQHGKYIYRYEFNGSSIRHVAITRKATSNGVTVYINERSTDDVIFSNRIDNSIQLSQKYTKGYRGRTGDKGLSSSAGQLSSLNPENNDVLRLSISSQDAFSRMLDWYLGIDGLSVEKAAIEIIHEKTLFKSATKFLTIEELEKKLALQREIGVLGEDIAYQYEYARLKSLGCFDPATNIEKISELNVGAGYDLKSDFAGEKRFIEVKSSTSSKDGFYISENERKVLTELGDEAFIYLVHVDQTNISNSTVRELADPFGGSYFIGLQPVVWYAELDSE